MNNLHQLAPSHFGNTEITPVGMGPHHLGYGSPVSVHIYYFNYLPTAVTVGWRSGLQFTLAPQPSMTEKRLIVRVKLEFTAGVKGDIIRYLSTVDQSSTAELRAMRDALQTQLAQQGNNYGGPTFVLDYPITLEELRNYGGTVYYHDLDCLLSILAPDQVPPHPYSNTGRHEQLVQTHADNLKGAGFGYSIDIVDSLGRHGDRFINIGGKVYKIHAARDTSRRDGIYIVSNAPVVGATDVSEPEVKLYPFEGAEETLGIFRTAEEAATLGDLSTARKRELATIEHELQINKKNLQEVTQRHELEMADKNKEIERLKVQAEHDKFDLERLKNRDELERQRMKDFYDDRAYSRKDSSEALKMIPALIVGLGAIAMAIKAWTS
jgi:hypothetical protein